METFKINKHVEVVCESQSTRYGFRHLATLIVDGRERGVEKICYYNRTWESYTFESVLEKLAERTQALTATEKKLFQKKIKSWGSRDSSGLKTVSTVMALGNIFGQNQTEKNDWKTRVLKAGLENKGLIMPEDWNELSENEKEARLDGVIEILG